MFKQLYNISKIVALIFTEFAHTFRISSVTSTSFEGVGTFDNPVISWPFLHTIYRFCNNVLEFPNLHGRAFRDKTTILLT